MKYVFGLLMLVMAIVPLKRALFIFQQNRYETGRYWAWIKENAKRLMHENGFYLLMCVLTVLLLTVWNSVIANSIEIVLMVFTTVLLFFTEKHNTYIKPLVYTARVKRQIVVMSILYIGMTFLLLHFDLCGLYYVSAYFMPWIFIWPMHWITEPIEASVRKKFLMEAKHILQEDTRLISIGITGSFGKTTTKNIMQAILSEQFNSLMTPASYNTPMGITRTIREMLKPIHEVFVCEMGADHVGDIRELMEFVEPTIGVVTSVGPQHLNTFGSQENITKEKMEIIEMLPKDGFGVMNYDNEFIRNWKVKNQVETATYGIHNKDVDYRAEEIEYSPHGSCFVVVHGEERIPFETKLLGELNILNILSAVAVARHLGVEWSVIQRATKQMKQVEHRLELKKINGFRFIDDAFNANPTGSAMALEVLSGMPGKRIIVTPGMIDLGEKQTEINRRFGTMMKDKADEVILVGEIQTRPIYEGLKESGYDMDHVQVVKTEKDAFAYIWANATVADTILLENDLPDAFNH